VKRLSHAPSHEVFACEEDAVGTRQSKLAFEGASRASSRATKLELGAVQRGSRPPWPLQGVKRGGRHSLVLGARMRLNGDG